MATAEREVVRLRRAGRGDAERVFTWRNDPWIVSLSKSGCVVTRDEHLLWYEEAMDDRRHLLFIIELEQAGPAATLVEAGVVRLDRDGHGGSLITIYLLQPYTGRGYGVASLKQATEQAFALWPDLESIRAEIRRDNIASIKAFSRVGFRQSMAQQSREFPGVCEMHLDRAR
jgi:RimJ/RimL family protein N-acetyltransferase